MTKARPDDIQRKSEARMAVVKALYSNEISEIKQKPGELALTIIEYYDDGDEELQGAKIDIGFFSKLLTGVCENIDAIDQTVIPHLNEKWEWSRLGPVMQAILRSAAYELMAFKQTPFKVIVNEYVDITHSFFDKKEVGFVNGILDTIAKQVRDDK